jgi:transposase
MRKVREVLRLRWQLERTVREAAGSLGVSAGVVSKMSTRAAKAGLTWEIVETLDDATLEERLYGRLVAPTTEGRPRPDPVYIHTELRRPGVTLELLHLEYLERHPDGYRYTVFCDTYREWHARSAVTMRQVHTAGEKCFVDYSGNKPKIVDPQTGQLVEVELFVAVLGASNLTYVEASPSQRVADFVGSHVRAYEFFGGVSRIVVPDQLKSAVARACLYEPEAQRTYAAMARHYGTAIVPARPRKPRDKAKVEVGVLIAQRWILARLRNETFFSLTALNARIRELVEDLNARPMKKLGGVSRRALFERLERGELSPLPSEPFVYGEWTKGRVGLDYHVEVDGHAYSVPYTVARSLVWVWSTATTVEIYRDGAEGRVACHVRSYEPQGTTTDPAHMPEAHRRHASSGDDALAWAESVGPMTLALVKRIIEASPIGHQGVRRALALRSLAAKYGEERLELASGRALRFGARSYKPVAHILKLGREAAPLPGEEEPETSAVITHENVRGAAYYHS